MEAKHTVLLVDDEPAIVKIMARLLEMAGFNVLTAKDGEEGLLKAQTGHPHAIVLDLMLPKMNGFDVCAQLKKSDQTRQIPIVIFTARGQADEERCRSLGADAFFSKTAPASELITLLKSLIGATAS